MLSVGKIATANCIVVVYSHTGGLEGGLVAFIRWKIIKADQIIMDEGKNLSWTSDMQENLHVWFWLLPRKFIWFFTEIRKKIKNKKIIWVLKNQKRLVRLRRLEWP